MGPRDDCNRPGAWPNLLGRCDMSDGTPCSVDGCDRQRAYSNGMCGRCWQRWYKTGSTDAPSNIRKCGHERTPENTIVAKNGKKRCRPCREAYKATFVSSETCSVEGCDRPVRAKGLCGRDYQRMKIKGNTDDPVVMTPVERKKAFADASARWYQRHIDEIRVKVRERYAANREYYLERNRRYREANPDKIAAANRAWTLANPGRRTELWRQWREANPDEARAIESAKRARRVARIRGTMVEKVDFKAILAEHGMVCHICGGDIESRADLHMDHVIPLARGGHHVQENILPSHKFCNISKSDKLMSELTGGGD